MALCVSTPLPWHSLYLQQWPQQSFTSAGNSTAALGTDSLHGTKRTCCVKGGMKMLCMHECALMCKYIWCLWHSSPSGTRCLAEIPLYCLGEGQGVLSSYKGVSISVRDDCMCLRDALFPALLVRMGKCGRVAQGDVWRLWHTCDQPVPGTCLVYSA